MVNIKDAHVQWRHRPTDERYQSMPALEAAVLSRFDSYLPPVRRTLRHMQVTPTEHGGMQVQGSDTLFNNWSWSQLASLTKSPADFLAELPAPMAADIVNYRLAHAGDKTVNLHPTQQADGTKQVRAALTDRYGRIWDKDVVALARTLTDNSSWWPPLGYKDGKWGAPLVPSGLYASDRDVFITLVEEDHPIEFKGELLKRAFILQNSEVGSKKCKFMAMMYRSVCGNNIFWGATVLADIAITHLGRDAWGRVTREVEPALTAYVNSSTQSEIRLLEGAMNYSCGKKDEDVVDWLNNRGFSKKEAELAIERAHQEEGTGPNNLWKVIQGLTALAREKPFAEQRVAAEQKAGKLLALVK